MNTWKLDMETIPDESLLTKKQAQIASHANSIETIGKHVGVWIHTILFYQDTDTISITYSHETQRHTTRLSVRDFYSL